MTTSDPFLSPPSSVQTTPFLTSNSRPSSPTRSYNSNIDSYSTLPTPPSSSTNPFQFDPTPSTSSNSSHSSSLNNQNNQQNNQYFDPIHSLAPPVPSIPTNMMTRAASAGSSSHHHLASSSGQGNKQQQVPPIISYDPNGSPSDEEEDDDDGESGVQGGSRPRKRKSTRDLRGTASSQASAQASSSKAGNSGPSGDDDKDDDKGRRKIQIEYIEEKSKRHITFSKRKAGIMKKVSQIFLLSLLFTRQLIVQLFIIGLRTLNTNRNPSSPPSRFRIRLGLHFHDRQVQTSRQGRREWRSVSGSEADRCLSRKLRFSCYHCKNTTLTHG